MRRFVFAAAAAVALVAWLCSAPVIAIALAAISATLSVTVVPTPTSGGNQGLTPPPGAAAAGFTTLAANYDFSSSFYSNLSAWLNCAGSSSPQWWLFGFISSPPPCSNVSIVFDAAAGSNVLDLAYNPSDFPNNQGPELDNANYASGFYPATYPQGVYYEVVYRTTPATMGVSCAGACLLVSTFTWQASGSSQSLEWDIGESYTNNFLAVQGIDHAGGSGVNNLGGFYGPFTSYNTVGLRVTTDGSHYAACSYWNSNSPHCSGIAGWSGDQGSQRNFLKILTGPSPMGNAPSARMDYFVKSVRVWACPGWQSGQCNGQILTSGP